MRKVTLLTALASVLLAPGPSAAVQPCDNIRQILGEGAQYFQGLRGNFDFTFDYYTGTLPLNEFSNCYTSSHAGVTEYSCAQKIYQDSEALAQQAWSKGQQYLVACLGQELKPERSSNGRYAYFKYGPTNTTIKVRYQRLVSKLHGVFYKITIEFSEVDLRVN
ncbi:hypothetical protein [Pseudoduganella sp. R-34]|uniref:hypothetical protein n=1 Tax=Pseudoduganella sp. R-34 TaxID=3404062 RepID=UPI003CE67D30